ncbi:hypothetical protein AB0J83_31005 [Actinoplanes sp. NPDC049596]|uniref:hypothetical protein n=1 Tax=unclassified Actinoplanes TaxID=2626549 RepID=UPI00342D26E2
MKPSRRRTWNRFVRALRTQPVITALATIAALVTVARQVFLPVPEVWPYGEELGEFLYDFGLAILGAWIFNLLVVMLPRLRDQEALYASINKDLRGVSGGAMAVIRTLTQSVGAPPLPDPLTQPIDPDDLRRWCEAASDEQNPARFMISDDGASVRQGSWKEYLDYERRRVANFQSRLEAAYVYLPVELIALLREIQDDGYYLMLPYVAGQPNLAFLAEPLHDHMLTCDRLRDYLDRQVAPLISG